MVNNIRRDMPRIGSNKLYIKLSPQLKSQNIKIGRDAFALLLSDNNLLVRRKRSKCRTTFSQHRFFKYPNLIKDFIPTAPNQLWVSDITYISIGNGFIYLSLITDAFSHKIVGWDLAQDLGAGNALKALKMALRTLPPDANLIHHSDRGVQYCSNEYVSILLKHNVLISMTESGDPLENAIAERINGILKSEWIYTKNFQSFSDANNYIKHIITLYNTERPHQSISFLTPNEVPNNYDFNKKNIYVKPERKWKNYYSNNKDFVESTRISNFDGANTQSY